MTLTQNPLLDFSALPRFDSVEPAHVKPAIDHLLARNRALVEALADDATPASWGEFVVPLSDDLERSTRAWGIVSHWHAVDDTPAWRAAYNESLPEVSRFFSELG